MRLFLSFSSADIHVAEALAKSLRASNEVFFSPDSIRRGIFWHPVLADEIAKAEALVLLVGEGGLGPWQRIEYYEAFDRKVKDPGFPLVPIILSDKTVGVPFLNTLNFLTAGNDSADGLAARTLSALTGEGVPDQPLWKFINPFRDLEALDERSSDLFFGREERVDQTVDAIARNPDKAVILVGNSGVGKSSLAMAGVFAAMRRQRRHDGGGWPSMLSTSREWLYLTMRAGENPIESAVNAIFDVWTRETGDATGVANKRRWMEGIADGSLKLGDLLQETKRHFSERGDTPPSHVLLYIDQGEELLEQHSRAEKHPAKGGPPTFSRILAGAIAARALTVLMSIRADQYGKLQSEPDLFPASVRVDIEPLGRDAIQRIMTDTAAHLGVRFQPPDMPQRIAEQNTGEPGVIALLAVHLSDMWKAMQSRGDGILRPTDESGTISLDSALRRRAEGYYSQARDQDAVRRLFVPNLVRVPPAGPALRKVVRVSDLADVDGSMVEIARDLSAPDMRLLVMGAERPAPEDAENAAQSPGAATVEVSHEVLFSAWPALKGWIDGWRPYLEWEDGVRQSRKEWAENGKPGNLLLTGGRLTSALEVMKQYAQDVPKDLRDYVERSRTRRTGYRAVAIVALVAVFLGLATGIALLARANNTTLERLAEAQRNESRYLAAEAIRATREGKPLLAVALALEALPEDPAKPDRPIVAEAVSALAHANYGLMYPVGTPMRHEGAVESAVFSLDGTRIVTASWDNTARLWDAASGAAIGTPMRHEDNVRSTVFSPDGMRIVTASEDGTARLWDAASGAAVGAPMQHEGEVYSAAFSPEGRRIVTASQDGTARFWDAASGEALGMPMRHEGSVTSATFSPDGTRIVTASWDHTARLWDAASGKPIGTPMRHEYSVTSAAFSPDGMRIVTASEDGTARLWDAASGEAIGTPMRHKDRVISAAFSPEGRRIVTASLDGTARLWDAASGEALGMPMRHEDYVTSATFSPDGTRIVTASWDGTARLWDAASGEALGTPMRHEDWVGSAAFSPDGMRIVTASNDFTARLWDAASGEALGIPMRHEDKVISATFSPDGTRIITASDDGTARLWDAVSGEAIGTPKRHEGEVGSAAFSPDGTRIVTVSSDNTVRLWDAASGAAVGTPMRHEGGVRSAAFSPDGTRIVTASDDNTARLWDAASGEAVGPPMRHEDWVRSATFSPDGTRIVSASQDATARLWDATSGAALGTPLQHQGEVYSATFSPDGKRIVTASADRTARLWDAGSGAAVGSPMWHEGGVLSAAFSPDGRRIVTASNDTTARLWDAASGAAVGMSMRHGGGVRSAAFSPDGTRIVTASKGTARLWDAASGAAIGSPMRHQGEVRSAAFSPDGKRIVTASNDGTARLWDADIDVASLIASIRKKAFPCLTGDQREQFNLPPVPDIGQNPDYCH